MFAISDKKVFSTMRKFNLKKNYRNDISLSTKFLEGKSDEIIKILIKKMDIASNSLEYEYAATCRDQIESLRHTSKENNINIFS